MSTYTNCCKKEHGRDQPGSIRIDDVIEGKRARTGMIENENNRGSVQTMANESGRGQLRPVRAGERGKHVAQLVYFFLCFLLVFFTNNSLFFLLGQPRFVMTVHHGISTPWYKIKNRGFNLYLHNLHLRRVRCDR
jgi:hypothetical protein